MAEKEPAKPDFSQKGFINGPEDAIFMAVVNGKPVEDTSETRAALAGRKCIGEIKQGENGELVIDYTGGGKVVEACGKCMWGGGYRGGDPTDVCPVYESDAVLKLPEWERSMLVPPKAEGEYEWEPEGGEGGDEEDDEEGGEPEEKKGILGRLGDKIGEFIGGIDLGEMGEGLKGAGENIEKWLGEKFGAVGGWLNGLKPGGGGGEGGGEGGGGESGGEGGGGEDGGGESKGEGEGGEDGGGESKGEGEEAKPGEEPPEVAEAGKGVIADIKEKVKGAWEGIKGKIKGLLPGMPTIPGLGGKGGEDGDEDGEPTEGPEPDAGREKAHKPYKNHAIFHFVLRSFYDRAYQPDQLISPSRLSFPVELLQGVFVGENVREQLEISASYFRIMFGYRRQTPLYFVEGTVDEAAARSTFRDPMFNCLRPDYETFVEPNTGIRFRYLVLRLEKFPDQEARSVLDNFYQEYKFQRRVVPVSVGEKQAINGLGGILGRIESGLNFQNPSPAETQGSAVVDMRAVGQELQAVWVSLSGIQSRLGSAGLSAEKYEEYGRVLPALENELQELIGLSTQQPSDESRQQFARLKARVEVNFAEVSRLYKLHYGEIEEQIEHVVSNMESDGITIVDVMFLEGALRKRLAKKLSLCAACGLNSICTEPNARRGEIRRRKTIPDPVPQGPDLGRMVHGQPQTPPDESVSGQGHPDISGQQEPIVVPPGRLAQGGGVNANADPGASGLSGRRRRGPRSPYNEFIRGDDQQATEGLHGVSDYGQDGDIQMIDYPPSGQATNAGSIDQTGAGYAGQNEAAAAGTEDDDTDGEIEADYEESDDLEAAEEEEEEGAIQDESGSDTEAPEPKKGKDKLARVASVTPSQRPHGSSDAVEP